MGACPSSSTDALVICGEKFGREWEVSIPRNLLEKPIDFGCHKCCVVDANEVMREEGLVVTRTVSTPEPKTFSIPEPKMCQSPSPSRQSCISSKLDEEFSQAESPTKAALSKNHDLAKELRGLAPEGIRARLDCLISDWREKLEASVRMQLDGDMVTLAYDPALQCLDVREQGALYPLAALGDCIHLPREVESKEAGASFKLKVPFHDYEAITVQFDCGHDRAAFALALHALAVEARQDKWHEDLEGWDDDAEEESSFDDVSTAEPDLFSDKMRREGEREAFSSDDDVRDTTGNVASL